MILSVNSLGFPAFFFIRRLCGGLAECFRWSPTGKPVAPLSFADSLRERRDSVSRHPDRQRIHPRLKPGLSAVGVKVVVIKRNANQSLSVTKGKAFYFLFPGTPASLLSGGYARLRRGLLI